MSRTNLFADIPADLAQELTQRLLARGDVRIERIVSRGHRSAPGEWYDQDESEWVVVLRGSARLEIEGRPDLLELGPGDHADLPSHCRHRVDWTDPDTETVWLAVFFRGPDSTARRVPPFVPQARHIIGRDLRALRRELLAYDDERDIWVIPAGISNSAGTLALHLAGNLRHFLGARLGGSGYARDRGSEFADRDVPRSELIDRIGRAEAEVVSALDALPPAAPPAPFPQDLGGTRVRTDDFLLHLVTHLAYHLGQVDYHRRLVTGANSGVGAMAIPELWTAERLSG